MHSMPSTALAAILFLVTLAAAYLLDLIFGPIAVVLVSVAVIGIGLWLHRDWMSYAGGLIICAGLTYDVILDTVQSGSVAAGLFAIVMLGAVAVCSLIAADKLRLGL